MMMAQQQAMEQSQDPNLSMEEQQQQLEMLNETANMLAMQQEMYGGENITRYDDVYYPRTDKRMISKCPPDSSSLTLCFNRRKPIHLRGKPVPEKDQLGKCSRRCHQLNYC
jgi:hypothetical protein